MSLNICRSSQIRFIVLDVTSNVIWVNTYVFVWLHCLFHSKLINYFPCRDALYFYWLVNSHCPLPLCSLSVTSVGALYNVFIIKSDSVSLMGLHVITVCVEHWLWLYFESQTMVQYYGLIPMFYVMDLCEFLFVVLQLPFVFLNFFYSVWSKCKKAHSLK